MSAVQPQVLLVDDEPAPARVLAEGLHDRGIECSVAPGAREAIGRLESGQRFDTVITDLRMPHMDGLELARRIKSRWSDVDVVILTAYPTTDSALRSGQIGIDAYLTKPITPEELERRVRAFLARRASAAMRSRDEARAAGAAEPSSIEADDSVPFIIGRHPSVQALKRSIVKLSGRSEAVLIEGESGTGKELVARGLHECGPRKTRPFLAINCGAIPESLLESELFGYVKGAFTGAMKDRDGLFVAAGEGTVFLDEIGELPRTLQVKLLRSLQEKEVFPLGGSRPVSWKARVVCATNADLGRAVAEGNFREDLFYRVNVLRLEVPTLADRRSDIPILVQHFLARIDRGGSRPLRIAPEALELLTRHRWRGNIRELYNSLVRIAALALGHEIQVDDLPKELRGDQARSRTDFPTYDDVTRRHIVRALRVACGVQTRAASLLGMDRNRLARMMKRYRIEACEYRSEARPSTPTRNGRRD